MGAGAVKMRVDGSSVTFSAAAMCSGVVPAASAHQVVPGAHVSSIGRQNIRGWCDRDSGRTYSGNPLWVGCKGKLVTEPCPE